MTTQSISERNAPTTTFTPKEMAYVLFGSGLKEDDVVDMIKEIGDISGYTPKLNECGKEYLAMCHEAETVGKQAVLDRLSLEFAPDREAGEV